MLACFNTAAACFYSSATCMLPWFCCLHASIVLLLAWFHGSAACMVPWFCCLHGSMVLLLAWSRCPSMNMLLMQLQSTSTIMVLLIMLPWFSATCMLQLFCYLMHLLLTCILTEASHLVLYFVQLEQSLNYLGAAAHLATPLPSPMATADELTVGSPYIQCVACDLLCL